ncbi:MAG: DUF4202 family protein [Candidatus Falkowbacteria bacterium]
MTNLYRQTEEFVDKVTGGSPHLERTTFWLQKLKPDASEALLIAARSHDIERAFRDGNYDKITNSDKGYQSEEHLSYHQAKGAEIMSKFLKEKGADRVLIHKVSELIANHEVGGDDDQNLIKDADSLSFFENNVELFLKEQIKKTNKEKVRDKFNWMFNRITSKRAKDLARPFFEDAIKKLDSTKKRIAIFSHGFGVRKDDLGLLSSIAEAMPEVESILFDYFEINEKENIMSICPLSSQVERLNTVISKAKIANPGAVIDLICHSQGTIVAAMAKPVGIRKTILLAPVFDMSLERTLARYRSKSDAIINLEGISKIPSSSGLTRIIPKEYWQERLAVKPFIEYNAFAKKTEIIAIEANQDQLLSKVDLKELDSEIQMLSIDGDHNFNDLAREPLIKVIKDLLR